MSEEMSTEGAEPSTLELRAVATVADFNSVDIEAPIGGLRYCDPHAFFAAYEQAFVAARAAGDEISSDRLSAILQHLHDHTSTNRSRKRVGAMVCDNHFTGYDPGRYKRRTDRFIGYHRGNSRQPWIASTSCRHRMVKQSARRSIVKSCNRSLL